MSDQNDFNKAFRDERYGSGAGTPTSLGGTLGQMSARQQHDLASGRVRHGASGALVLEMMRGGPISRGILVLIVGFILGVAGATGAKGSWWVLVGLAGGSLLTLAGCGMIAYGTVRKILRALR